MDDIVKIKKIGEQQIKKYTKKEALTKMSSMLPTMDNQLYASRSSNPMDASMLRP